MNNKVVIFQGSDGLMVYYMENGHFCQELLKDYLMNKKEKESK
jgi:hypothetical protein